MNGVSQIGDSDLMVRPYRYRPPLPAEMPQNSSDERQNHTPGNLQESRHFGRETKREPCSAILMAKLQAGPSLDAAPRQRPSPSYDQPDQRTHSRRRSLQTTQIDFCAPDGQVRQGQLATGR